MGCNHVSQAMSNLENESDQTGQLDRTEIAPRSLHVSASLTFSLADSSDMEIQRFLFGQRFRKPPMGVALRIVFWNVQLSGALHNSDQENEKSRTYYNAYNH